MTVIRAETFSRRRSKRRGLEVGHDEVGELAGMQTPDG